MSGVHVRSKGTYRQMNADAQDMMSDRFGALCAVSVELARASSFDEMCRLAVSRGREALKLDRLGLWLQTGDPLVVEGTFGTDESGAIRDERGCRLRCAPGSDMGRLLLEARPSVCVRDAQLLSHHADAVGHGTHLLASLWDGESIIGCLAADDLLRENPITDVDRNLFQMYATMVGHLCTRSRTEDALRMAREEQRKLLEIVNRSPAMVARWQAADKESVDFVSKNIGQLGYTVQEFIDGRRCWMDVLHPDDCARLSSQIDQHQLRAGSEWFGRYRIRGASGAYRWFEGRHYVMADPEGKSTHVEGIYLDVTTRRELEQKVAETKHRESATLGVAIHETLRQDLAGLVYLASAAEKGGESLPPTTRNALAKITAEAEKAAVNAQHIGMGVAPAGVPDEGLTMALRHLAQETAMRHGLECRFTLRQEGGIQDATTADNLYYIAVEAIANTARHAETSSIDIELWAGEEGRLLIRADGAGFDVEDAQDSLGFRILHHRAETFGGVLTVSSSAGAGTVVDCQFSNM